MDETSPEAVIDSSELVQDTLVEDTPVERVPEEGTAEDVAD